MAYKIIDGLIIPTANQANQTIIGDATGTTGSITVTKLQGHAVLSTSPIDGYVLTWVNVNNDWEPKPSSGGSGFTAGGDLSGTSSSQTVIKINGTSVPSIPSANQVLVATSSTTSAWSLIVDGYINSNAAIAGTKINPNFGSQTITTTGSLNTGSAATTSLATSFLSLAGEIIVSAISAPSFSDGYTGNIYFDSTTNKFKVSENGGSYINLIGGSTGGSAGGDLSGTYPNPAVISITGSSGTINISTTGANINWVTGTSSPTLKQADNITNSATAQTLTVQAANATGTTSVGGALNITSGTGTSTNGNVNLQVGGTTTASVVTNKFVQNKGWRRNVTSVNHSASPYTIVASDNILSVTTAAGVVTVNLPASPTTGDMYDIKDTGALAATSNITVSGNGNNIDGSSTYVINQNYSSLTLFFNGTEWSVL